MAYPLTVDQKRDLCAQPAKLNGDRAAICGALEPFALVISLEDSTKRAYYSWETVADMVANYRGRFLSAFTGWAA